MADFHQAIAAHSRQSSVFFLGGSFSQPFSHHGWFSGLNSRATKVSQGDVDEFGGLEVPNDDQIFEIRYSFISFIFM